MTLIEMMVAITIFSLVLGGSLSFMRAQGKGFATGSDRMAVLQNLRYASSALDKDLRTAGSNVPDIQPFIVYADANIFAFNADYATNVAGDPFGVYYDPDAPDEDVTALTVTEKITLPGTLFAYPDTTYKVAPANQNSTAETIIFYFEADTSTARSDDYVLYRQTNNKPAEAVARNLLRTANGPFFSYYHQVVGVGSVKTIAAVPVNWLPLKHTIPIHLAPADTGVVSRIDSLKGVQVNFTATNGQTGAAERTRAITRTIRLPNAGLATKKTCGDEPILGTALVAVYTTPAGVPTVKLTWNRATDESGGEKDVVRYVIYKKLVADPDFGDPYLSIPAGSATYTYLDQSELQTGQSYLYGLAAQDCTPSLSSLAQAGPIAIP